MTDTKVSRPACSATGTSTLPPRSCTSLPPLGTRPASLRHKASPSAGWRLVSSAAAPDSTTTAANWTEQKLLPRRSSMRASSRVSSKRRYPLPPSFTVRHGCIRADGDEIRPALLRGRRCKGTESSRDLESAFSSINEQNLFATVSQVIERPLPFRSSALSNASCMKRSPLESFSPSFDVGRHLTARQPLAAPMPSGTTRSLSPGPDHEPLLRSSSSNSGHFPPPVTAAPHQRRKRPPRPRRRVVVVAASGTALLALLLLVVLAQREGAEEAISTSASYRDRFDGWTEEIYRAAFGEAEPDTATTTWRNDGSLEDGLTRLDADGSDSRSPEEGNEDSVEPLPPRREWSAEDRQLRSYTWETPPVHSSLERMLADLTPVRFPFFFSVLRTADNRVNFMGMPSPHRHRIVLDSGYCKVAIRLWAVPGSDSAPENHPNESDLRLRCQGTVTQTLTSSRDRVTFKRAHTLSEA